MNSDEAGRTVETLMIAAQIVAGGAWRLVRTAGSRDSNGLTGWKREVLEAQRSPDSTLRTVLVDFVDSQADVTEALRFAAERRARLAEPSASALYMIVVAGKAVSEVEARRVEADERYCRKYVWLATEPAESLVKRTFLGLSALPEVQSSSSQVGPKSRILEDVVSRGVSGARATDLLDQLAAMSEQSDVVGWVNRMVPEAQ